jgi:hypothetical protein
MMYAEYLSTAEAHRWVLDTDIAWDEINPSLALQQPDLLDRVRDSALIESYFPLFTPKALSLLWDDVNATAIFSIQLYESYKHFHVFNQYLQCVGYRPIDEAEIIAIRRRNEHGRYPDGTELLTRYMMSEHFAAQHFFKDAHQAREPVLAHILQLVGRDEVRHAQFAYDLLDLRVRRDPAAADKIVKAAREFRHIGLEVVTEMPIAQKNDLLAIFMLNQKLHRLTGRGLESLIEEASDEFPRAGVEAQLVSSE